MPVLTAFENVELPLLLTALSRARAARARRDRARARRPGRPHGALSERAVGRPAAARRDRARADHRPDADRRRRADRRPRPHHRRRRSSALLERLNRELGKTIIMVTHDPKAAGQGAPADPPRERRAGRLTGRATHVRSAARPAQRVPPQAAHHADDRRHRRRDRRVRPAAHDRRRLVRGRRTRARRRGSITRNAISLVFPLPLTYAQKIRQVPGVASVAWANWFGGVYISERNFFPQFAIERRRATSTCIPEFRLSAEERKAFLDRPPGRDRRAQARRPVRLEGRRPDSAARHDLSRAPGSSRCAASTTAPTKGDRHVDVLLPLGLPERDDQEAAFRAAATRSASSSCRSRDPEQAAEISQAIDATFKNSLAETLTETEKAFQLGFVAMTEAILRRDPGGVVRRHRHHHGGDGQHDGDDRARALRRVRDAEGAGFGNGFVALLIFAESLAIALVGGVARHRADVPARATRSPTPIGIAVPDLLRERGDDADAARRGARRRRRRRASFRRGARRACASSTACARWREAPADGRFPFTTSRATSPRAG